MSESTTTGRLGVIAGSGVRAVDLSPTGERVTFGPVAVLVDDATAVIGRHGIEPTPTLPHLVDHRANLAALVDAGCDRVLALCSTGSLRADWVPGTIAAPDDIFSPWANPEWHGDGRDHVVPGFVPVWRAEVIAAWRAVADTPIHDGATYVQARGPRFESKAEVRFYGTVGDVVGMTMATELVLANQAGLAYAAVCAVDNLGNGLAEVPLAYADFEQGVAENRARLLADVTRVVAALARAEVTVADDADAPGVAVDVVLPVLDEAEAIPWVLERVPVGFRAIVVDNGSTDGSADIAALGGATVVREARRGFGAACFAGLTAATAPVVAFMDCDASLDPGHLVTIVAPVEAGGADLVVGERVAERGAWPPHARLANRYLARRLNRRFGWDLRDPGPMRAGDREALVALGIEDRRSGWPLEMLVRAGRAGWVVTGVDVPYHPRVGRSKVTGTVRGTITAVADQRRQLRRLDG